MYKYFHIKTATQIMFATLIFVLSSLERDSLHAQEVEEKDIWTIAGQRAIIYQDCGTNAARLLKGWIDKKRDPETHLYPKGGVWNYHDEAADHYSSLVLIAFYVNQDVIKENGTLHQTLLNYQKLCSTPSGIPTLYNLKTGSRGSEARLDHLSEWLRDGLIRIVEVMGTDNDWYRDLERLTDAMLVEAEKKGGMRKAFTGTEAPGNMMQTLARLYAMSGKERYLKAAESLADLYLNNTEGTINKARFLDHGCELIPGLGELFALECQIDSPKAKEYSMPLREILDSMLETNSNPTTGLLCSSKKDADGNRIWIQPPDTWGYVLFTYENYDRGTGKNRYRKAIEKPLLWLTENRQNYSTLKTSLWPHSHSSDDWSDSYESMIVLWNRYPHINEVFEWLDWATLQHIHRKKVGEEYGPYTGGHFDGSTGRTLCMHMMLNSQGVRTVPFIEGLRLGGVQNAGSLYLVLGSDAEWKGKIHFDPPRNTHRAAKMEWARINEMPQWFVAKPGIKYTVNFLGLKSDLADGQKLLLDGQELIDGIEQAITSGQIQRIVVSPVEER